jgi:hypothetical protein
MKALPSSRGIPSGAPAPGFGVRRLPNVITIGLGSECATVFNPHWATLLDADQFTARSSSAPASATKYAWSGLR